MEDGMGKAPRVCIPIATGTFAERDLRDRFADFINLKDYGAVGDQVTDDTRAWNYFQTAEGGVKYIPKGHYRVNGDILHYPNGEILGYVKTPDTITNPQIHALFE